MAPVERISSQSPTKEKEETVKCIDDFFVFFCLR